MFDKSALPLLVILLGVILILGPAILSPGFKLIFIIFIFLVLQRLFIEQFEMEESMALLVAGLITFLIYTNWPGILLPILGLIILLSAIKMI